VDNASLLACRLCRKISPRPAKIFIAPQIFSGDTGCQRMQWLTKTTSDRELQSARALSQYSAGTPHRTEAMPRELPDLAAGHRTGAEPRRSCSHLDSPERPYERECRRSSVSVSPKPSARQATSPQPMRPGLAISRTAKGTWPPRHSNQC
jgi:hypothetical protein